MHPSVYDRMRTLFMFSSVDKIMEKCFFPVIHHLAVTIKAKFIPTELFKNFCLRKKCRIR
jgi:hypothetical protein